MLAFLRIFKIPGLLHIMKDWQALLRIHFIYAAYESGLLQALASPCDKKALVKKLGVQRPALLDAILEMGLATKELSLKNNAYQIRGKRSKAVIGPKGDVLAATLQANVTYYGNAFRHAAHRLKGGELGNDLNDIGPLVARLSKGIEPIIHQFISTLVSGNQPMRILDVGCGSGVQLQSAYNANQQITGIGLDVDEAVVVQARENMDLWGLGDQFDIIHGDILETAGIIDAPFDLITLYNNLYYFNNKDRKKLIHRLSEMLAPQGVLAIVSNFSSNGKDLVAANLNMVTCSLKGLTPLPTIDEITSLLVQCGLSRFKVHRFIPGSTLYGITAENY